MMKKRTTLCCFLAILEIMSMVSATSRPYSSQAFPHQDQTPHFPEAASHSKQGAEFKRKVGVGAREETYRALGRLGSRPPNCKHECKGCVPCEAIQIPATSDKMGVQYANYEPEGWKCKCGNSFFNP